MKPISSLASGISSASGEWPASAVRPQSRIGFFGIYDPFELPKDRSVQYRPSLRRGSDMTVGIAVACDWNNTPKIVMCSDFLISSGIGSVDNYQKCWVLKNGWYSAWSGEKSAINILGKHYVNYLSGVSAISDENISTHLRQPLQNRKRELANEFVQSKFAMSYEDFLKTGKENFPEETYRRTLEYISRIELEAEAIIAGFADGTPNICTTTTEGTLSLWEDYATIGEGATLAQAALMNREHDYYCPLSVALYNVYEAKKHAERVRSVGITTGIYIYHGDGRGQRVSEEGLEYLDTLYKKYNPKEISDKIDVKESHFMEIKVNTN